MSQYYLILKLLIRLKLFLIKKNVIFGPAGYSGWIKKHENYEMEKLHDEIELFKKKPLISIVVPVFNVDEKYLKDCIESVRSQIYSRWELCIADDCSDLPHIKKLLDQYLEIDNRIRVVFRTERGHISACSNSALEMATGEYVAFLDNDDLLSPTALYEVVKTINNNKFRIDLMFSDEDKIKNGKRVQPFFKKKWNLKLLLHVNYFCHLTICRNSIIKKVGGFREGFEGAQDWDLALRITSITDQIVHIPKILYHWRMIGTSTASGQKAKPYIYKVQKMVIRDAKSRYRRGGSR